MNKRILFGLLLAILSIVTMFNVYAGATSSDHQLQAEIIQLQAEKKKIEEENQELKQTLIRQEPAEIEARHQALVKQANTFVETAFVQSQGTCSEHKKEAKALMSEELIQTFFPSDLYKGEIKTSVENVQILVEAETSKSRQTRLLIRFDHALHDQERKEKQVTPVFLEVEVEQQDGQWIIVDFKEARKEG